MSLTCIPLASTPTSTLVPPPRRSPSNPLRSEIFLRELISNANDAIEKLRLTALTNKDLQVTEPLNITIVPDLEKKTLTITGQCTPSS